jgi:hypothetical protein
MPQGGGYDISASVSEASTQGLKNTFGAFNNGGGIRIPEWFWPVALAIVVIGAVLFFRKK